MPNFNLSGLVKQLAEHGRRKQAASILAGIVIGLIAGTFVASITNFGPAGKSIIELILTLAGPVTVLVVVRRWPRPIERGPVPPALSELDSEMKRFMRRRSRLQRLAQRVCAAIWRELGHQLARYGELYDSAPQPPESPPSSRQDP